MSEPSEVRLTPARRQYLDIKVQYPADTLLLYRMGDFYETFDDDARRLAEALHITLTSREFGKGVRVPLAGIPYHALNGYLGRLLAKGFKVAICEQVSDAGKGLVDRAVVRVVTPGTISQPELLRSNENSYLAAVHRDGRSVAIAFVDVTTGEFAATQFEGVDAETALEAELARLAPAECLVAEDAGIPCAGVVTTVEPRCFDPLAGEELLLRRFRVASLEAFGCAGAPAIVGAAASIVAYLERTSPELLHILHGFRTFSAARHLVLDPQSRRNLDLVRSARSGASRGGLLTVIDRTHTPMGSRLLRRSLSQPLIDVDAINARLDAVAALVADAGRRRRLVTAIERLTDMERLTGRICQGTASGRDCRALAVALRRVPALLNEIEALPALVSVAESLDPLCDLADLIERAVADTEGRLIAEGFDARLDSLRGSVDSAQQTLLELERRERERTGIRSLKVGYTRVFGYYIEVTRPNLALVPKDYRHKQTLANAERYITAALRDCEGAVLQAEERAAELEQRLFESVLEQLAANSAGLLKTAGAVALLDFYVSLAEVAVAGGYVRPSLDDSLCLELSGGRHPVVEANLPQGGFIANDTMLDGDICQIALVTGPNMAGKSTYLRQIALCTVLAQMGSFVPAAGARIGVVDRIFTRIGAQDDITAGASTFMVEMIETAAILRHATRRSLVLLDEVGRGTGTQDGMAIAQAVIEYLHHYVGARTLFATHFHELTGLTETLPRLRNFNVSAVEEAGRLVFLHRVLPGGSDRSYGVHVARLAGIPPIVAARAEALLRLQSPVMSRKCAEDPDEAGYASGLISELAALDVLRLSPLDAAARLHEFQQRAAAQADGQTSPTDSAPLLVSAGSPG
ncbi:MAG: DNA mismatch repair protein MutS [Dehalococcoidia bacterium]